MTVFKSIAGLPGFFIPKPIKNFSQGVQTFRLTLSQLAAYFILRIGRVRTRRAIVHIYLRRDAPGRTKILEKSTLSFTNRTVLPCTRSKINVSPSFLPGSG